MIEGYGPHSSPPPEWVSATASWELEAELVPRSVECILVHPGLLRSTNTHPLPCTSTLHRLLRKMSMFAASFQRSNQRDRRSVREALSSWSVVGIHRDHWWESMSTLRPIRSHRHSRTHCRTRMFAESIQYSIPQRKSVPAVWWSSLVCIPRDHPFPASCSLALRHMVAHPNCSRTQHMDHHHNSIPRNEWVLAAVSPMAVQWAGRSRHHRPHSNYKPLQPRKPRHCQLWRRTYTYAGRRQFPRSTHCYRGLVWASDWEWALLSVADIPPNLDHWSRAMCTHRPSRTSAPPRSFRSMTTSVVNFRCSILHFRWLAR